jgi:UDP-N-acetylmuramyl tripeptide synthase
VVARHCELQADTGSLVEVDTPSGPFTVQLKLPGLYNVYNALAAVAVAQSLGVELSAIAQQLESFHAAWANAIVCSGTRAEDLAVRLKYAGLPQERLILESEPRRALEQALSRSEPGDTIYVLPTYTAMLEVRDVLRKTGYVGHFYED